MHGQFQDPSAPFVELCDCATTCSNTDCKLVHFKLRTFPQTEASLGDCSYLNACHHLDVCRYKHYRPATPTEEEATQRALERNTKKALKPVSEKLLPPQWIDCDLRKLDVTVLGKFDVIMADPPWDSKRVAQSFLYHHRTPYGSTFSFSTTLQFSQSPVRPLLPPPQLTTCIHTRLAQHESSVRMYDRR